MFLNWGVGEDLRNQSWIFIGRTDAEAETPILWPPDAKSWLTGKDPDAGKDWRWEEKGTTEDEMVGWHYRLGRHGFEQAPGAGDGQGGLACCSPWGCKESDTTEGLNWAGWEQCQTRVLTADTDVKLQLSSFLTTPSCLALSLSFIELSVLGSLVWKIRFFC